jgi:hypothetical protein
MPLMPFVVACSDTRALSGQVVDIWGKPVPEATVVVEGVLERYTADTAGKFQIETRDPVVRVMAGANGYIKEILPVPTPAEEDDDYDPLTFKLYPEPEQPGFYAVGREKYIHLAAKKVQLVGTDLEHWSGIQDIPDEKVPKGKVTFVFSSTLRSSELSQMNLHLSRLDFVDKVPMKGVLGKQPATVQLWVAKEDVPFDLRSLPSKDDYLLTSRADMTAGMYAFHAQDILNELDERVLRDLPRESQVAFPFEVN